MERRIFCVVNPNSANGSTGKLWSQIATKLGKALGEFESALTEGPGHATELVRGALSRGALQIIAVGGDGTLNEVVNGFFDENGTPINPEAALGFIPRGTGGDYRKTFGMSTSLDEAISRLTRNKTQLVDIGCIKAYTQTGNQFVRYFINIMSFGVSGLVDYYCNTSSKALGGRLSFLIATLRAMSKWRNRKIRLRLDDKLIAEDLTIQTVAIAIGKFFGGGMMVAPNADPSDGLFDVVMLGDFTLLETLTRGFRIYSGNHITDRKVKQWRARRVYAEPADTDEPIFIDLDGETPGILPVEAEILPSALKLIV